MAGIDDVLACHFLRIAALRASDTRTPAPDAGNPEGARPERWQNGSRDRARRPE